MKQYTVTGMSCAACSARVEKAVSGVPGVTSCSVSLLTNSMGVEGTASAKEIIAAVEKAGYGATQKSADMQGQSKSAAEADELLKDSIENTIKVSNHEFAVLIADCNEYEKRVLLSIAKSAKESLRENRHLAPNRRR